jgi:hypothetical protein
MTDPSTAPAAPEAQAPEPRDRPIIPRPETDADALRAIARVRGEMHERVQAIRRAPEDHEPKLVLSDHVRGTSHEMAKQQIEILNGQNKVLAILDNFASKDMPGKQAEIQDTVHKIYAILAPAS